MKYLLVFLALTVLNLAQIRPINLSYSPPEHYDYIIIGAGIAGLGASSVLTANSASHLIL